MSYYTEQIENLLNKLELKYSIEHHKTGGTSYYFRICTVTYVLFTSCWKDYGLHIAYKKKTNGQYHYMKMLDFETSLTRIETILTTILACKPNCN